MPDVPPSTPLRAIKSVAVIGAGTMGGGIAMNFANAGVPVTVLETSQAALDKGLAVVKRNYESTLKKGRLSAADFDKRLGLIKGTLSYDDIASADLVIEAVFEDMQVKKQVFETLDQIGQTGRDSGIQHLDPGFEQDREFHASAAGCGGTAFLQSRERDQTARNRARRQDREGRDRDKFEHREADQEDRRRCRGLRRLHRQSHVERVFPPDGAAARRGRAAAANRQGAGKFRLCDGAVPGRRSRRQRYRLVHPQAAVRRVSRSLLFQDSGSHLRIGTLRTEDRRRLVRLQARRSKRRSVRIGHSRSFWRSRRA